MFGVSKEKFNAVHDLVCGHINQLHSEVSALKAALVSLEAPKKLVTCEDCGCAVLEADVRKGKSEIRTRPVIPAGLTYGYEREEYIYKPLRCKRCHGKAKAEDCGPGLSAATLRTMAESMVSTGIGFCSFSPEQVFKTTEPTPTPDPSPIYEYSVYGVKAHTSEGTKTELIETVKAASTDIYEDGELTLCDASGGVVAKFARGCWSHFTRSDIKPEVAGATQEEHF